MSNVLYRKYRSKSFSEIIGQETVVSILKESIIKGNVSHAYLFCGPRGTGKTSIARIFSRAVNCLNFEESNDVCNHCENCLSILNEQAMDIIEMDAASNRGIEEIRNLKDSVNYLPTSLSKKVYIIDEAHMLTKEAFNALLKTLEEPPQHVIFILATTEAHKLPITILSRVERYDFRLATKEEMIKKLGLIIKNEKRTVEEDIWDVIYTKSGGSFRDAESLLGKIITNNEKKKITKDYVFNVLGIYSEDDIDKLIKSMESKDLISFQLCLNALNSLSGNINTLIDQVLEKLHKMVIESVLNSKDNRGNYIELINLFIKTKKDIRDFSDKRMILELNIINYMNKDTIKSVGNTSVKTETRNPASIQSFNEKEEDVSKKFDITTEIQGIGDNVLSKIAMTQQIKLPRLKAILMNSHYEIENEVLSIFNKYKFNVAFLQRPENVESITKAIESLGLNIKDIMVTLGDREPVNKPIENTKQDLTITEKIEIKGEESVDNSDIIEDIL